MNYLTLLFPIVELILFLQLICVRRTLNWLDCKKNIQAEISFLDLFYRKRDFTPIGCPVLLWWSSEPLHILGFQVDAFFLLCYSNSSHRPPEGSAVIPSVPGSCHIFPYFGAQVKSFSWFRTTPESYSTACQMPLPLNPIQSSQKHIWQKQVYSLKTDFVELWESC